MPLDVFNITRADFQRLVSNAKHGERIVYHIGFLRGDRRLGSPSWETTRSATINAIGIAAWEAAEAGHVRLFQKKIETNTYEYIAEKCDPPRPIQWEGCYLEPITFKPYKRRRENHQDAAQSILCA